jgi:hypothetical protein
MLDVRRGWGLVGALALSLGACAPGYDDFEGDFEELELRSGGDGGTFTVALPGRPGGGGGGGGDWIGNGLHDVDISGIDPAYGLSTPQGMAEDGELLTNEALRGTAEYLVECALPAGQSIVKTVEGQELVFEGALGLAPQWKDDSCGSNCQEWITACLLARTNASAEEVPIWVSGNHLTLGLGRSPDFPLHEAAFFGNVFEDPEAMYFCRGQPSGVVAAYLNGRTCTGLEPEACGFTHYGNCYTNDRCEFRVRDGRLYTVECAAGDPATGHRYKSISTFVMDPED